MDRPRDHAMFMLTIQTGLRISELAGLTRQDVTLGAGTNVHTIGKGRKERRTPLLPATRAVLKAWPGERPGAPGDPLFPTRTGTRLSRDAIERRLARHLALARTTCPSLRNKRVSMHTLRHYVDGWVMWPEAASCPALGTHPRLICPLRDASLSPRDGRPKVLQPPEEPPKICRQTAITLAPDVGARYRQDLPYGSPAWHARYATLRNTIEGLNGYAKDPARQALAQPGRRRVRGIAACSLFTALLLMAASIRKIRAWRALTGSGQAGPARRARRRRTSLRNHLPDG